MGAEPVAPAQFVPGLWGVEGQQVRPRVDVSGGRVPNARRHPTARPPAWPARPVDHDVRAGQVRQARSSKASQRQWISQFTVDITAPGYPGVLKMT